MKDIIIVLLILIVVGIAAFYIIRAKKKGKKCIGCTDSSCCSGVCSSCSRCTVNFEKNTEDK